MSFTYTEDDIAAEDLCEKARIALDARNDGDPRYVELLLRLGDQLGMPLEQVELNIVLLAAA